MFINYDAMLSLPILKGSEVVSGEKGLYRTIRWVHIYEMAKPDEAFRTRVSPGSFVLTSCIAMEDATACLSELIYGLADRHCAGLGIGMGYAVNDLPFEVLYLSNCLAIPIIKLPNDVKFIDITYQVSHLIFDSSSSIDSAEELLRRLPHFEYSADLRDKAINLGYQQSMNYQMVVVQIDDLPAHGEDDPSLLRQEFNNLMGIFRSGLTRGQDHLFLFQENYSFILMLPMKNPGENVRKLMVIQQQVARNPSGITISAGVGSTFQDLSKIHESLRAAKIAMQMVRRFDKTNSIMEYATLGTAKLFYLENAKEEMTEILQATLGGLLDENGTQNDELLRTLDIYLASGENIGESAEQLFMHRNTLKYRIKRIQEILGCDLRDAEQRYELRTALKILNFLRK